MELLELTIVDTDVVDTEATVLEALVLTADVGGDWADADWELDGLDTVERVEAMIKLELAPLEADEVLMPRLDDWEDSERLDEALTVVVEDGIGATKAGLGALVCCTRCTQALPAMAPRTIGVQLGTMGPPHVA